MFCYGQLRCLLGMQGAYSVIFEGVFVWTTERASKINEFSVKHNIIFPENSIAIYIFTSSAENITLVNERRFTKQKRALEERTQPQNVVRIVQHLVFTCTDCFLCGKAVDKVKARKHPSNQQYEYSNAMNLSVKAETITKRCAERQQKKTSGWVGRCGLS